MAAYDIQKHFKGLRVESGRRKSRRDPFATGFEDDSDDEKKRPSRSQTKQAPAKEKPLELTPAKTIISDTHRDSEDEHVEPPKRINRYPSPAPAQLPNTRVTDGARRRGSLDKGLQSSSLPGRSAQTKRPSRSAAVVQAAGALAYLDDSDSDDNALSPTRPDRNPSPAPRKKTDPPEPAQRSTTPKGNREAPKELGQGASQPSRNSVASAFAGTKYLQDSDSDEEAISSRKGSVEDASETLRSPDKDRLEVKRVDKGKQQNGGGVSWRAFSAGRAEQRTHDIAALQVNLKQRGKSISFGSHATTDDGSRIPVQPTPAQIFGGATGRKKSRGKSPPRRAEDTKPTEDEVADGGPVGVYDPTQFKTNPFTGRSTPHKECQAP